MNLIINKNHYKVRLREKKFHKQKDMTFEKAIKISFIKCHTAEEADKFDRNQQVPII